MPSSVSFQKVFGSNHIWQKQSLHLGWFVWGERKRLKRNVSKGSVLAFKDIYTNLFYIGGFIDICVCMCVCHKFTYDTNTLKKASSVNAN